MVDAVIHCTDVHGGIKKLAANSVDLIYTNPPYGITNNEWDLALNWYQLWPEMWRVLRPGGNIIIHCSQPFTTDLICTQRKHFKYVWHWEKTCCPPTNPMHAKSQPLRRMEEIAVFARQKAQYYPQFGPDGKHPEHILRCPRERGKHTRPNMLIDYMLMTYTTQGQVVLDLTTGKGETLVRCLALGRSFIGYQLDPSHLMDSVSKFIKE